MSNRIIKHRVAYFAKGSRSERDCLAYIRKNYPWYASVYFCEPLNLVAVFSEFSDCVSFSNLLR